MKKGWKYLIQYGACFVFTALIFLVYVLVQKVFQIDDKILMIGRLSDPFVISGVILIGSGLLTLFGKLEFFDAIRYGFVSLIYLFIPSKTILNNRKTFYEYKQNLEKKGRHWYPFLVYAGAAYLLIGIIIFIIYLILNKGV